MARIDTTCPECGAPHARKLSVIHSEGISQVQTNVDTVGKLNTVGRHKIETKGTLNGTQQTEVSRIAAPPVMAEGGSTGMAIKVLLGFVGALISVVFLIAGEPFGVLFGLVL